MNDNKNFCPPPSYSTVVYGVAYRYHVFRDVTSTSSIQANDYRVFYRPCTSNLPVPTATFLRKHDGFTDFASVLFAPSHNRDSIPVRIERSVFEFRLLRGARHVPADRTVVRRTDQVPGGDRAHVSVRLHLVQSAARQTPVRHRVRHGFHAVAARLHPVHGTRTLETGNHRRTIIARETEAVLVARVLQTLCRVPLKTAFHNLSVANRF